jgi:hypothetical protein
MSQAPSAAEPYTEGAFGIAHPPRSAGPAPHSKELPA